MKLRTGGFSDPGNPPSRKALETRNAVLDAAERLFAAQGFDGVRLSDIAKEAGVQPRFIRRRWTDKTELFTRVVTRRADDLAVARLGALATRNEQGPADLRAILDCFFRPFLDKALALGPQWLAFAHLNALISTDSRWDDLAARCFDPTANKFIDAICELYPEADRDAVAHGFIYAISCLLALMTADWRIATLGRGTVDLDDQLERLLDFCTAGMDASTRPVSAEENQGI